MSVGSDVQAALRRGDLPAIATLLEPLNEAQRKAVREEIGDALPRHHQTPPAQRVAATLTRLGIASIGYVRRELAWDRDLYRPELRCESLVRVVRPRPASFRQKLPQALLDRGFSSPWQLIRFLVREGVCPPVGDEARWALALAAGVPTPREPPELRYEQLDAALRSDPELLEHDVWLLFRHEEAARLNSEKYADTAPDANVWSVVLRRLTDDGTVPRDRVLDEALAGLERDLPASAVGFAQDVHRRLDPTTDELAARSATYIRLVSNPVATTQRLALAACTELHRAGALDTERFAEAARVPLQGTQKNVAVAALRVAERVLDGAPRSALRVAIAGLQHARADVQERALALLESAEAHLDPDLRAELLGLSDVAAPTLTQRIRGLAGIDTTDTAAGPPASEDLDDLERRVQTADPSRATLLGLEDAVAAVAAGRWPTCRSLVDDPMRLLGPTGDVAMIEDAEELVGLVAGLLEGVGTAVDAERALAGIAARAERSEVEALTTLGSPLRKRASALLSGPTMTVPGYQVRTDWAQLVVCWLEGRPPPHLAHDDEHPPLDGGSWRSTAVRRLRRVRRSRPPVGPATNVQEGSRYVAWAREDRAIPALAGFTALRMHEVARMVAKGRPVTLAATPTHRQGWVEPGVLVARLAQVVADGDSPGLRFDIIQALHRLPPGDHAEARRAARDVPGPVGAAVRRRLGAEESVPDEALAGASAPPHTPPLRLVPGTVVASYNREVEQVVIDVPEPLRAPPPIDDPVRLVTHRLARPGVLTDAWWGGVAPPVHGIDELSARWHTLALPSRPELLAATVSLIVGALNDLGEPRLHPEPLLAALVDPGQTLTWEAAQAIAACLLAKAPALRAQAADVLIAATGDGRIDPLEVGARITDLIAIDVGVLTRCVDPLRDVASVSPTHAGVVFALLQQFVIAAKGTPRGVHAVLALLLELAAEHRQPVSDATARARLEQWTDGASKRAKAAKRLLAAQGEDRLIAAAQRAVLAALIGRAEWTNR